jgi:hypothetical protein
MQSLDDPDRNLEQRVLWRLQQDGALYELWWLPTQGRYGLVLHRNGELFDAVSFDRGAEALARAEAWRFELQTGGRRSSDRPA